VPPLAAELFDYSLPSHLVAQTPADRRDASRLLVIDRRSRRLEHRTFADLPAYVGRDDWLIRNNAAVLPARLLGRRPTGGQVECLLLRPMASENTWRCLVRPGRKLPVGAFFDGPDSAFRATIAAREADGSAIVSFSVATGEDITAVARRFGQVPLPPYIERDGTDPGQRDRDLERYQTVYADPAKAVAVAAPTAGLHFTPELLATLAAQGVRTADVTLHVGLGTFRPIATETIEAHDIHREIYEIPASTRPALLPSGPGRRIAVGTTTVRSVEHFLARTAAGTGAAGTHIAEADLYIYPPYAFRGIDALITNFHQPRSTLLCLVSAFLAPGSTDGIAWMREIYAEAIAREYRFFSYGDAMLIL
jgi:S-adenosylmethionine:tRNA ribosyltransferase-isomerase